jgi:hypothetical protein
VLGVDLLEQLGESGSTVNRDLGRSAGQSAQDRRHAQGDGHVYANPAARNASSDGLIVAVGRATGSTASSA